MKAQSIFAQKLVSYIEDHNLRAYVMSYGCLAVDNVEIDAEGHVGPVTDFVEPTIAAVRVYLGY